MKYDLEPRGWIVAEETFDPLRPCGYFGSRVSPLLPVPQ